MKIETRGLTATIIVIIVIIIVIVITLAIVVRRLLYYVDFVTSAWDLSAQVHPDYFASFSDADREARECRDTEACAAAYVNGIRPPTIRERACICWWASAADARCANHPVYSRALTKLLLAGLPRWRVCITSATSSKREPEGGFPHTHGRTIVLPERFLKSVRRNSSLAVKTIVHERLHIAQRAKRALCEQLYHDFWRLQVDDVRSDVRSYARSNTNDLMLRGRSNPDLDGKLWAKPVDNGMRVACVCAYERPENGPPCLSKSVNVMLVKVDRREGDQTEEAEETEQIDRRGWSNLTDAQGNVVECSYEHPNEAMAYIVSELVMSTSTKQNDDIHVLNDGDRSDAMFPVSAVRAWLASMT
jgi:hypothetical protein